ncbi:hypothetical protein [Paenibacillus sp. 598K]|uniref:hypothetical protein n=1 Tax=Paenibacillus sp. 598K TaxID=1117987 RepID=UPI000FFF4DB7|nr:hypothetical protein [Paenibacillus sp. 598K]
MKTSNSFSTFGGIALIVSGVLFLAQSLFLLPVPGPPLADSDLLSWLQDWKLHFAMADELLFFATLGVIPSIIVLYRLAKTAQAQTLLACGIMAIILPVNMVIVVILGRLAYPVYGIELDAESYRLLLSLYYGGVHTVALLWSAAVILICFVIRKSPLGKTVAYFGFAAGILQLVGAYPWLFNNVTIFVAQLMLCVWFVMLGIRMIGRRLE